MWGDAGYIGVQKREENLGLAVDWQVAMKPGQRRQLEPESDAALGEKAKASIRAKMEHPFPGREAAIRIRQGTLPGLGQEHEPVGAAAGAVQPETRPSPSGRLTMGAVCAIAPPTQNPSLKRPKRAPMNKNRRAVSLPTNPHKSKIFTVFNCSEIP